MFKSALNILSENYSFSGFSSNFPNKPKKSKNFLVLNATITFLRLDAALKIHSRLNILILSVKHDIFQSISSFSYKIYCVILLKIL